MTEDEALLLDFMYWCIEHHTPEMTAMGKEYRATLPGESWQQRAMARIDAEGSTHA